MRYTYFPGCSLKGMGKAYEESFLAVFQALGVEIEELENWNCCGATAYMSVDENDAVVLATRNLAINEKTNAEMIAPCSACYLVLNKADKRMRENPKVRKAVTEALDGVGLTYEGTSRVRHPLDIVVNDIGFEAIKAKVKKPLKGLKVACYYGCQIIRPYALFDDQYNPQTMDRLMEVLGAEVVRYPLKTKCCGGSLTGTMEDVGERLNFNLLKEAKRRQADVIVTVCPLCQFNLEGYQDQIAKHYEDVHMPVVFFTQLIGLAMGISQKDLGLQRQITGIQTLIKEKALVS